MSGKVCFDLFVNDAPDLPNVGKRKHTGEVVSAKSSKKPLYI